MSHKLSPFPNEMDLALVKIGCTVESCWELGKLKFYEGEPSRAHNLPSCKFPRKASRLEFVFNYTSCCVTLEVERNKRDPNLTISMET